MSSPTRLMARPERFSPATEEQRAPPPYRAGCCRFVRRPSRTEYARLPSASAAFLCDTIYAPGDTPTHIRPFMPARLLSR